MRGGASMPVSTSATSTCAIATATKPAGANDRPVGSTTRHSVGDGLARSQRPPMRRITTSPKYAPAVATTSSTSGV
jgi:hypothetical protein